MPYATEKGSAIWSRGSSGEGAASACHAFDAWQGNASGITWNGL